MSDYDQTPAYDANALTPEPVSSSDGTPQCSDAHPGAALFAPAPSNPQSMSPAAGSVGQYQVSGNDSVPVLEPKKAGEGGSESDSSIMPKVEIAGGALETFGGEHGETAAAPLKFYSDAAKANQGIDEMRKGKVGDGILDTTIGASKALGDIKVPGANGVAVVGESAKAAKEWADGAANDDPMLKVKAIDDGIDAGLDAAQMSPNPWVSGPAKAASLGKNFGKDVVAPVVFGKETDPGGTQLADGTWVPSTGNRVVDGMAGVGQFSPQAKAIQFEHMDTQASSGAGGGDNTIQYTQNENGEWVPANQ